MFEVVITGSAERDIQKAYQWWHDNRSPEEAERWYDAIYPAIRTLRKMPRRCSLAAENARLPFELRELLFGIGSRATHRVLFEVDGELVIIHRVRHTAQDRLSEKDF